MISAIVTLGYGSFGSPSLITTLGYVGGVEVVAERMLGNITVSPLYAGRVSVEPLYSGRVQITKTYSGTARVN
jgi:hypothetical protein